MSQEDLREHGVLLPEEEWGRHRLETTVPEVPLATAFLVAVAAVLTMYLGAGGRWTWIGLGVFLASLYVVVWLCDRAVRAQRDRTRRERKEGSEGDGPPGAP